MSESPIIGRCRNSKCQNRVCQNPIVSEFFETERCQNLLKPESARIWWCQNLMVSESERVRIFYTWKVLKSTKSWVFEISDSDTFMFLSASRSGRAQSEFQRLLHRDVWRVPTHACFGWQYSAVLCPQDWLRFPLHWIWWAKVSIAICCEFLWDIRIMCNDSFYTSDSPILSC